MMKVKGLVNTQAVLSSLAKTNGIRVQDKWIDELAVKLQDRITISPAGPKVSIADDEERDLLAFVSTLAKNERAITDEKPNTGSNPWLASHRNVTAQHRIERDNPERAAILQREAAKIDAGGDPANPFSRAGFNVTRQHLLLKTDPERAAHLAAEAGVKI